MTIYIYITLCASDETWDMYTEKTSTAHVKVFFGGPSVARKDHLWHCRWSGGPSVAAILGPGGPSMIAKNAIHDLREKFWGDNRWHDRLILRTDIK